MRPALAIVSFAVCASIVACSSAQERGAKTRVAGTAVKVPLLRFTGGDYDPDDYVANAYDADNDDSSKPKDGDNDSDSVGRSLLDSDDREFDSFPVAGSRDRRAVSELVRGYFRAAAAGNGAAGCAMILPNLARSIPESLGRPPGPPYLRGTSCPGILAKIFVQNHKQLIVYATRRGRIEIRVDGDRGYVLLWFPGLPAREIGVLREGGNWKMGALLDQELP